MVTVVFTNGDTQEINANEGFYLGGGAAIIDDARSMEYHLTLAYKFAVINGSNGDVDWTRIPLEALVFYRFANRSWRAPAAAPRATASALPSA